MVPNVARAASSCEDGFLAENVAIRPTRTMYDVLVAEFDLGSVTVRAVRTDRDRNGQKLVLSGRIAR